MFVVVVFFLLLLSLLLLHFVLLSATSIVIAHPKSNVSCILLILLGCVCCCYIVFIVVVFCFIVNNVNCYRTPFLLFPCLTHTGGYFHIVEPPKFQVGEVVQLYHETVLPKGFAVHDAELLDTRRRVGAYEYVVQMEGQQIWIPERLLQRAGGYNSHGSPTKRKRPVLQCDSPTKGFGAPSPTAAIAKQLQDSLPTTPPTMINSPSGETTPGESPPAEPMGHPGFAAVIVPDLMSVQRKLQFANDSQVRTFTQQTQEDNKPVSVSDLVVKESDIVPDISFLRMGKRTGLGLFMPSNFTGLKLTEDIYLDDSILTAAATIRGTWRCDYAIADHARVDCVWVPGCKSAPDIACKLYRAQHSLTPSHKCVQDKTLDRIRLVCIRPMGPGEEITYFYGNRLYVMAGIGPVPAGQVNIKAGPSSHEEVEHGGNDD